MGMVKIDRGRIKDITEMMCDKYCKMPDVMGSQEELTEICNSKCPLNTMLLEDDPLGYCPEQE